MKNGIKDWLTNAHDELCAANALLKDDYIYCLSLPTSDREIF
jgi:hypothetical protein